MPWVPQATIMLFSRTLLSNVLPPLSSEIFLFFSWIHWKPYLEYPDRVKSNYYLNICLRVRGCSKSLGFTCSTIKPYPTGFIELGENRSDTHRLGVRFPISRAFQLPRWERITGHGYKWDLGRKDLLFRSTTETHSTKAHLPGQTHHSCSVVKISKIY